MSDQSPRESRIRDQPFHVNLKRRHVFLFFKWLLIAFNGVMIVMILGGIFVYFTEYRQKSNFQLDPSNDDTFSDDLPAETSGEPKYSWIVWMFAFALLLMIPCLGFVGAIKEHVCLLVLYGVIFFVEAVVFLIFQSFWFLLPSLVALAAIGLVFLIRSESNDGSSSGKDRFSWCLDKI